MPVVRELPELDNECFFIAPIGADGSPERSRSDGVLDFIVSRAAEELGFTAIRADQIAEPGQITMQVIDHIIGARVAVADLTGLNPNVFYELAVRHTARLPVALIAEKGCKLPFDIAQMRTIFFDYQDLRSADQCRRDIVAHLREAIDKGAVDSPIATSVDVRSMRGGDAVERSIAELVTTVQDMSRTQRMTAVRIDEFAAYLRNIDYMPREIVEDLADRLSILQRLIDEKNSDPELTAAVRGLEQPMRYIWRTRRPQRVRARGTLSGPPPQRKSAHEQESILNDAVEADPPSSSDER